jgi:hypothetical protein
MNEEKIPRRLKRFYREGKSQPKEGNLNSHNRERFNSTEEDYSGRLPSMSYEDLTQKANKENLQEIEKLEKADIEEKLALVEVEKFKKENKRLPTRKESEQIADNLFTQLKENDDVSNAIVHHGRRREQGNEAEVQKEKMPPSRRARSQREQKRSEERAQEEEIIPKGNIKDLFGSANGLGNTNTKNLEKEFSLDLGDGKGEGNEAGEIKSFEDEDKNEDIEELNFGEEELDETKCPNCGKKTEQIIYCSKCGAAFCKNCSKKENGNEKCPKCGAIVNA